MASLMQSSASDGSGRARLMLGGRIGVQIWALPLPPCLRATLMICARPQSGPVVLLSSAALGTPAEGASIAWALALVAEAVPGFYALVA